LIVFLLIRLRGFVAHDIICVLLCWFTCGMLVSPKGSVSCFARRRL
jgi:hypothetical protein